MAQSGAHLFRGPSLSKKSRGNDDNHELRAFQSFVDLADNAFSPEDFAAIIPSSDSDRVKMLVQSFGYFSLVLNRVAENDIPRFGRHRLEANRNEPDIGTNLS